MKVLVNVSVISEKYRGMGFFTVSILTKIIEREDIELILVSCGEVEVNFKKKLIKKISI